EVAGPLAAEVESVLTTARGDVLTIGVALAMYFSSSGIESLRIGLNRAYDVKEPRSWWLLRLESIGYVLIGAVALIALAFLVTLDFHYGTACIFSNGGELNAAIMRAREAAQP